MDKVLLIFLLLPLFSSRIIGLFPPCPMTTTITYSTSVIRQFFDNCRHFSYLGTSNVLQALPARGSPLFKVPNKHRRGWQVAVRCLFLHLTVSLILLVCGAYCTEFDVCSDDKVFLGAARDREGIINKMTVILQTKQPTNCGAGVCCRTFCLDESFEWILFEMRKASPYGSFTFHLGVCVESYVLLFKHFENANYPDLLGMVSRIYL